MAIVIKTMKVVGKDGVPSRKILGVEALGRKDGLPKKYLCGAPRVLYSTFRRERLVIVPEKGDAWSLPVGGVVDEETFQKSLDVIRRAGDRLHKINKEIERKREEFGHGKTETFII